MSYDLLLPMAVLALWTLNMLIYTEIKRAFAIREGRVALEDFRYGDGPKVPTDIAVYNRNYMNLLESPLLFYIACLAAVQYGRADPWIWRLAWAFVALRVAHSIIHTMDKHFVTRIVLFSLSLTAVGFMWLKLAYGF